MPSRKIDERECVAINACSSVQLLNALQYQYISKFSVLFSRAVYTALAIILQAAHRMIH